jgi:predicted TIM-barrel fold metal-dependent hydrolase
MSKPRIVDAHCHVPSERFTPRSFIFGAASNTHAMMVASGSSRSLASVEARFLAEMQDHRADALVAEMDAAGIDRTVLLCPDFSFALPDCALTAEEALLEHRAILRRHRGRFEAFAGVDPRWAADGVALFERAVSDWNFSGFKIYPPCGYTASDPALFPFYEICAARRLPIMVHTGPTSPALSFHESRPFGCDVAAKMFPGATFILAHASIAFSEECVMMAAFRPNVYLDISGFQRNLYPPSGIGDLRRVLSAGIAHKVLFGTDWPVFRELGSLADAVAAAVAGDNPLADLPAAQLRMVLSGNIERILAQTGAADAGSAPGDAPAAAALR